MRILFGLVVAFASGCSSPEATGDARVTSDATPDALGAGASGFVYVTNSDDNTVSQFHVASDGSLAEIGTPIATGMSPSSIVADPAGRFTYVADRDDNTLSAFAIGSDGTLATLGAPSAAGEEPFFAAVDRSGSHLYIVDYGTGLQDSTISQFTIGADGSLTPLAPAVAAGSVATSLAFDRTGRPRVPHPLLR